MIYKILLLLAVILPAIAFSQKIINIKNVNLLRLAGEEVNFYHLKNAQVSQISLNISCAEPAVDGTLRKPFTAEIESEENFFDTAKLFNSYDVLVNVNDLEPMTVKDFRAKLVKTKWTFAAKPSHEKLRYELVNFGPSLLTLKEYNYELDESRSYEAVKKKTENDTIKKWMLDDFSFFSYFIILLGNNRQLAVLLDERGRTAGYIIPTKKGWLVNTEVTSVDYMFKAITLKNDNGWLKDIHEMEYAARRVDSKDFYQVAKAKDGKYQLLSLVDEQLLSGSYDTIMVSQQFVIAKVGNNYTAYNLALQRLAGNLRSCEPGRFGLQILVGNNLQKIDMTGRPAVAKGLHHALCGTVPAYYHQLDTAVVNGTAYHSMLYEVGGPGTYTYWKRHIIFKNLPVARTKLKFISGLSSMSFDGNDFFIGSPKVISYATLLYIAPDNKQGLVDFTSAGFSISQNEVPIDSAFSQRKERVYTYPSVEGNTVEQLPAQYDSIVAVKNTYRYPLRIYRNGLIGLYPSHNDARYSELGKFEENYIRYTLPNSTKGWLNMENEEEYPDK